MNAFKRSRYFYLFLADQQILDLQSFLAGQLRFSLQPQLTAVSVIAETESVLTMAEMSLLVQVPADRWISGAELATNEIDGYLALATKGLLLSTSDEDPFSRFRQREEHLAATQWNPNAAFYHFKAKQPREIGIVDEDAVIDVESLATHSEESFAKFVARNGPPPPPFNVRRETEEAAEPLELPRGASEGSFYEVLRNRRTSRAFDATKPMDSRDLATILYYSFGCHGYAQLSKDVVAIKRTSPSGGCMHPIEVYPLVLNVAAITPGLYHYDAFRHALRRLKQPKADDLAGTAIGILGGQSFAGSAHVLLIMTARFERNFWKYRNSVKTYGVVLMDAGHLSQTCYLLCSHLRIGAFFSAAINAPLVEQLLELNGITEGAIGVFGCGQMVAVPEEDLGLDFRPFTPRKTTI